MFARTGHPKVIARLISFKQLTGPFICPNSIRLPTHYTSDQIRFNLTFNHTLCSNIHSTMTSNSTDHANESPESQLTPPDCVIGMKDLDRDLFTKNVSIPTLSTDRKNIVLINKVLKKYLLKMPNFKPIVHQDNGNTLIYLNPNMINLNQIDLYPDVAQLIKEEKLNADQQVIKITYDNFSAISILRHILKNESEQFSSFSIIGHLIHLNLKSILNPYKKLIGHVLLDKNTNVQVVINKLDAIDNTFRNFTFEILASRVEPVSTKVKVRETGCTFTFDFAKVYWNPRLGTEHERIVKLLQPNKDVVYDVFAGVGPFAVPIAKSGCKVLANDLNPHSFSALKENIILNKVQNLKAFNLDGHDFIKTVIRDDLVKEWTNRFDKFELQDAKFHILMNLPAIAVEFLSSFVGLFNDPYENDNIFRDAFESSNIQLPIVHCYAFYKGLADGKQDLIRRAVKFLNWPENESTSSFQTHFVRTVAPNKIMLRLTLTLPKSILVTCNPNKKKRLF